MIALKTKAHGELARYAFHPEGGKAQYERLAGVYSIATDEVVQVIALDRGWRKAILYEAQHGKPTPDFQAL